MKPIATLALFLLLLDTAQSEDKKHRLSALKGTNDTGEKNLSSFMTKVHFLQAKGKRMQ